jgi:hypothetical protein
MGTLRNTQRGERECQREREREGGGEKGLREIARDQSVAASRSHFHYASKGCPAVKLKGMVLGSPALYFACAVGQVLDGRGCSLGVPLKWQCTAIDKHALVELRELTLSHCSPPLEALLSSCSPSV